MLCFSRNKNISTIVILNTIVRILKILMHAYHTYELGLTRFSDLHKFCIFYIEPCSNGLFQGLVFVNGVETYHTTHNPVITFLSTDRVKKNYMVKTQLARNIRHNFFRAKPSIIDYLFIYFHFILSWQNTYEFKFN